MTDPRQWSEEDIDRITAEAFDDPRRVDALWVTIKRARNVASANKQAAEDAAQQANVYQMFADRLVDAMKNQMAARDVKKVKTTFGTFARRGNGGLQPLEVDPTLQLDKLPEQFVKTTLELRKDEVRRCLAEGEELPFKAKLLERGENLQLT